MEYCTSAYKKIAVVLVVATAVFLFAYKEVASYVIAQTVSQCQNDANKSIDERVRTCAISASERANFKAKEIAKKLTTGTFARENFRIEIVNVQTIDGGLDVFARAWGKSGEQIGFGRDGSVDIERFRIFNPPVFALDSNGDIVREWQEEQPDGTFVAKQRRLREDAQEAILQVIEHNLSVMRNVHDSTAIQRGKVGRTTSTFFPDANPESTSVDGIAKRTVENGEDWATKRGGAGNVSSDSDATSQLASVNRNFLDDGWSEIVRGFVLFDTSSIPDSSTIDSATLSLYGVSKNDTLGTAGSVAIVNMAPASNTAIVDSDYEDSVDNATRFASDMTVGAWSTTGYNDFSFNATGLSNIDTAGVTKVGIRMAADADDVEPTSGGSNSNSYVAGSMADETGTTQDPKLVVEHVEQADPAVSKRKNADEILSSDTTLQDDDDLVVNLEANKTYIVDGVIFARASSADSGFKLGFAVPFGSTMDLSYSAISDTGISPVAELLEISGEASSEVLLPRNRNTVIRIAGTVETSSTAGDLQFQWAQFNSVATSTTVLEGGYLRTEEI